MNPILLDLGIIQIRYYGLMYALALFAMLYFTKKDLSKTNIRLQPNQLENIILLTFLGGVLGARLYYVLFNLDYYFSTQTAWYEPFAIWHGGLAIHGGILGGALFAWLSAKKYNVPFLSLTDLAAPYIILGQALGRIGNFMNGDAHGVPTQMPWGMVFSYGPAASQYPNQAIHPVMLYELILNFFGFLLLFFLRKKKFRTGFLSASYLLLYGVIRAIVTNFRADDLYLAGIRAPHLFAIISILFVFFWIAKQKLYLRDNLTFIR